MECRFIKHGLSISYDHVVKPCCIWRSSPEWHDQQHIAKVDLDTWHQSPKVIEIQQLLSDDRWPDSCQDCKKVESQGRFDSMRYNGLQAYQDLADSDITLEIRPGSTCNFACQTCWPEASSRVAQFQSKAGLIDIKNLDSRSINDFQFLEPIRHRIKQVVLLGGEPFYDKSCIRFLRWANDNLDSRITMFTNGSSIDFGFIENYNKPLCVVVSLDAVGKPAEYIRFGTVWDQVYENYQQLEKYEHVEVRVNVTLSIYNYFYLLDLIKLLCKRWPNCVTFGHPRESWLNEGALPAVFRQDVINRLNESIIVLAGTEIESGQKQNAINAVQSVINNLKFDKPWQPYDFDQFKSFVQKMDSVKGIDIKDHCEFLSRILEQPI